MPCHHRSSSPLLSPPVLIILLPTIILLFLIYAIPPLLSLTSNLLQPTISVKKSWDSLNVFLVIFAILCGVFAKRNDGGEGLPDPDDPHVHIHNASDPLLGSAINRTTSSPQLESVLHVPQQQWFGYSERTSKMYGTTPVRTPENVVGGLGGSLRRRSSYPDLRQVESLWQTLDDVQTNKSQFRFFFDDFEISNYRSTHRHNIQTTSDDVKEIPVDTFVLQSSPTPSPKSPTPPPPPPPPPRHQKQRTYETIGRSNKKVEELKVEEVRSTPPPTPPPPPPPRPVAPPSPMRVRSDQKHGRLERRKSNVKREIAMVWNSVLSNQRKRKRKQKATRNIYDTATPEPPSEQSQQPVPPPPPPPPPSSVFHNLFKKGSKTKKVHSLVSTAPPPPPPPPPVVPVRTHQNRSSFHSPAPAPATPPRPPAPAHSWRRPPLPAKPSTTNEDNVNSGCQSPLIPIPPPPPPFKMPEMRFFVKGDYVKIRSAQSSRSGSPEPPEEEVADHHHAMPAGKEESTLSSTVNVTESGEGAGRASPSVFCPSPDVNTKADNFIARLRDEWRLEKINSLREKKTK